ncbi:MAG: hypothetical protein IAE99_12465 [Rhodothermales bacterium]|nr:hypothetical protein [Rhodothermales bacterium]
MDLVPILSTIILVGAVLALATVSAVVYLVVRKPRPASPPPLTGSIGHP